VALRPACVCSAYRALLVYDSEAQLPEQAVEIALCVCAFILVENKLELVAENLAALLRALTGLVAPAHLLTRAKPWVCETSEGLAFLW
jgi:hypothetical protein